MIDDSTMGTASPPRPRRRQHRDIIWLQAAWGLSLLLCGGFLATPGDATQIAAPTERASSPVLLLDVVLPGVKTPKEYVETFWEDAAFYEDFLKQTGDIDVLVQAWRPAPHDPSSSSSASYAKKVRTVVTKHPVKLRMPGIPAYVKSTKTFTLHHQEEKHAADKTVTIKVHETNVVEGVPFSDRFYVVVVWTATWGEAAAPTGQKTTARHPTLRLQVRQHVVFKRSFWLEKVVEKDAASETLTTLKLWSRLALERIGGAEGSLSPAPFAAAATTKTNHTASVDGRISLGALARHVLLSGLITSVLVGLTKAVALGPSGLLRGGKPTTKRF